MMRFGKQIRALLYPLFLMALFALSCHGQSEAPSSPFIKPKPPAQNDKPVVASPLDSLEFNGVITLDGKTHVSLRDKKANVNYWLSESQAADDGLQVVRIESDGGEDKIVVRRGAATKELQLKSFDIVTLVVPKQPVAKATSTATNAAKPAAKNGAIKSASDDEVRDRMKRVAEEIRRRRAMRRSAAEQSQTNRTN